MKLKNILMCIAALSLLFGCSDDKEPILDKPATLEPTTMSIRIDADGTIISKGETDQTISNMYVLIFNTDNTFDRMASLKSEEGIDGDPTTAEKTDIEVKQGTHQVLVLANVQDPTVLDKKSLTDIQGLTNDLAKESNGNLTMSSEVMQVTFLPNVKNKIGYDNLGTNEVDVYQPLNGQPVNLYRSVARIQLTQISLAESARDESYGKPVSFKLNEVFIANAKGYSLLASADHQKESDSYLAIGATNAPTVADKLWCYGSGAGFTNEDVLRKTDDDDTKVLAERLAITSDLLTDAKMDAGKFFPPTGNEEKPIGDKYFYVYENENQEIGYQTLLILKGDYMYENSEPLNENDKPVEDKKDTYISVDRYYAIPLNIAKLGVTQTDTHRKNNHTGILRNTKYSLIITINGPGSDLPYIPDAHLYYNAKIGVAEWNEPIRIGGEIN